tara:strand:- start:192 stop:605 length:414 start_codon:yes stop_codon:yes gene_type:complete
MAIISNGTTVKLGDGASPEVFTALDEVISISGPSETAPIVDVTALDDTARAYLRGIEDGGEVTIECHWDPDDTLGQVAAKTAFVAQTTDNWKITFTDSPASVFSFAAMVIGWATDVTLDQSVKATIGLKLDGGITLS